MLSKMVAEQGLGRRNSGEIETPDLERADELFLGEA